MLAAYVAHDGTRLPDHQLRWVLGGRRVAPGPADSSTAPSNSAGRRRDRRRRGRTGRTGRTPRRSSLCANSSNGPDRLRLGRGVHGHQPGRRAPHRQARRQESRAPLPRRTATRSWRASTSRSARTRAGIARRPRHCCGTSSRTPRGRRRRLQLDPEVEPACLRALEAFADPRRGAGAARRPRGRRPHHQRGVAGDRRDADGTTTLRRTVGLVGPARSGAGSKREADHGGQVEGCRPGQPVVQVLTERLAGLASKRSFSVFRCTGQRCCRLVDVAAAVEVLRERDGEGRR